MAKRKLCYPLLLSLWLSHVSFAQWTDITNPQLGNITNVKFISPTNGWLINLSNTPPQGLLRTTDGGNTWTKILDHPTGVFHWLIDFDFYDDSLGYAIGYSDYFQTTNGGRTWSRQSGGASNPSSKIFSPSIAFAGGTYLYKSRDSLRTWSFVSHVPVATFVSETIFLSFLSPDTIIACGGSTSLISRWTGTIECYRSIDSGVTWQRTYLDTMLSCQATAFTNDRVGYVYTTLHSSPGLDPHEVNLKTTNAGASWFSIPAHIPAGSFEPLDAYFQNPLIGFLSGPGLARTTNGGITWNIVPGVTGNLSYMSWSDSLHGWVVGGDGHIYRTTTGGWLPIQLASFTGTHLGGTRVRLDWRTLSETSNLGFYVQRRRQSDTAFTQISQLIPGYGTTNEPHDYSFTDSNATINRWYYRLKQVDLSGPVHYTEPIIVDVTTSMSEQNTLYEFKLEQNYPNPFNPATEIKYQISEVSHVTLKVIDVLGREVATLVNEELKAGRYQTTFDASGLASGTYFYRINAGNFVETRKMALVR